MSEQAFGAPGTPPTWSSSDKDIVTTALGPSRLWVTVGHGAINEVFWPTTGRPQIRDLTFYLVGKGSFVDLKRVRKYTLRTPEPQVPLLTIEHSGDDYRLTLELVPDPLRDVLLIRFALEGPYKLAVIVAPHLDGTGAGNTAWVADQALVARRNACALALVADAPFTHLSAGFVGQSDGWQDLAQHGALTWSFGRAEGGTVALTGQLDGQTGLMALGFADMPEGAHSLARASLAEGIDSARTSFREGWETWVKTLRLPKGSKPLVREAALSAVVLKAHEDRAYPGALVASLSTPWGSSTDALGGYHLVWPRDATLAAFALVAVNQLQDAARVLAGFISTQMPDGHWAQNYYPNGVPFWTGVQLDEAAFPVLLAAKLKELGVGEQHGTRAMIARALRFVAKTGPTSEQDRWEESPGTNPFTLAVTIAALVAGAQWLEPADRDYALALADDWSERLESFCYVVGTPLAKKHGVRGYYIRIAPSQKDGGLTGRVALGNRNGETILASALVSMDFSYLTRLGLRDIGDQRIRDTIKIADAVLRVDTPSGPVYHRYNDDGYGEKADGSPFDGDGIGRLWPILTGERGHLALQAGEDPGPYLETMRNCASSGGLLPEQVWDSAPIPARGLEPGRPSGSAMPLIWTHGEFLKLLVAVGAGRPVELLKVVEARYAKARDAVVWHWRPEVAFPRLARGRRLAIEDRTPFALHYGFDGWTEVTERAATLGSFGIWSVTFTERDLESKAEINFTRRFGDSWEGADHAVTLGHARIEHGLTHEPGASPRRGEGGG
ncbi:MAG: glycoside hydrolase family 15 protein [Myxococcales bacterium]